MRVLFVSVALRNEGTATGILIGNMITEFKKLGHIVNCVGVKGSLYDNDVTEYHGGSVYYADYVLNFRSKKKQGKDLMLALKKRLFWHNAYNKRAMYDNWQVNALVKKMEEIGAEKYDLLIGVCANYDAIKAIQVFKKKKKCNAKCVLIQYDPLSNNFNNQHKRREQVKKYEKEIFEKCDAIFTAPFILDEENRGKKPDNMVFAELPAVIQKNNIKRENDCEKIYCIYAGDFYPKIREPFELLKVFSAFKDNRIELHIVGNDSSNILQECAEGQMKGKLFYHGRLSEEKCNYMLSQADVFVNIGNKVNNQLPSKILNYVCYGKPIINIYSNPKCQSVRYLAKYPLTIDVDLSLGVLPEKIECVEKRLIDIYKERIEFEDVSDIYESCEPQYVVRQIIYAINNMEDK